jgi:hypothetical protein
LVTAINCCLNLVSRVERQSGLDDWRLDLATSLVHGVDVGAQGCRLPFEFLQVVELLEAGMHKGTVSPRHGSRVSGTGYREQVNGPPRPNV